MKKTSKTIKSVTKFSLVVDFTNPVNIEDPRIAFIDAKVEQRAPITKDDIYAIVDYVKDLVVDNIFSDCNAAVLDGEVLIKCAAIKAKPYKKKPWYKRFWNWITRKK